MASAYCNEPRAETIVDVNNGLFLDIETLRGILLHDEIKEKKVCVVSIAGAFRQGKSFLLNLFVRYLTVTSDGRRDLKHWLTTDDGLISGFSWKGGSDTVTNGILIWSEIFLRELPSGEEVAVVLMDTQGSFDNETTLKNCAAIFALSTLISSVQIYNLKDNIKSLDLTHLQFFLRYGQLVRQSGDRFPFQNLLFLIRDWATPEQHLYGMEGGKKLLDKVLDVDDRKVSPEIIALRRGITELFKEIDCYLLPHPGLKVTKYHFDGNLDDIEDDFKKYVEILATTLLAPENLVPKVINGDFVKVKHLVDLFGNYCKEFKSNDMPEVESLVTATANAQHMMALEEAEAVYHGQMTFVKNRGFKGTEENLLLQKHYDNKKLAVEHFLKKKIIGDQEMKGASQKKLEDILEKQFTVYENLNKLKLQEEKEEIMRQQLAEQQCKISDLKEEVVEERQRREELKREHQRAVDEQQNKISQLMRELDEEKENIADLKEEQKELIEEQRNKILVLEKRVEEEMEKRDRREERQISIQQVSSVLQQIDRGEDPAAKVVKGAIAIGYGIGAVVDGVCSSVIGLFKLNK